MRYIYMDGYRGFSKTLIKMLDTNFLVGENSSGKTSFLSLVYLIHHPHFWFNPDFSSHKEVDFSTYKDIASANGSGLSSFRVGLVDISPSKKRFTLFFQTFTFKEKTGNPVVARCSRCQDGKLTIINYGNRKIQHKSIEVSHSFDSMADAEEEFKILIESKCTEDSDLEDFPKGVPYDLPPAIAFSFLKNMNNKENVVRHSAEIPFAREISWIAPIRTRPKRFYDGMTREYSSEGEHTPMLLRRLLRTRLGKSKFPEKLEHFGMLSGLFKTITAHAFGRGNQTPFELLIKLSESAYNIKNVGYGMSQALPLVVEFLSAEKGRAFTVQQPEVHLHPRAQAALGGLVYELAKDIKHNFYIETHSDYLIDRYRLSMRNNDISPSSQVIYFERTIDGNKAYPMQLSNAGIYPENQPVGFREFFINEEMSLLGV
ncbi:MAG: AAA family ATPase [Magnetococcales bacterium]|nr:AAA family ATPase [Magnetococcales bacterium]